MDGPAFDSLARRLAGKATRRAAALALLGAGLGARAAAMETDAAPAPEKSRKPKCKNKCGKACCTESQVCSKGACIAAKRCPAKSGIDGFCPKDATCCAANRANRNGGCCHKQNSVCCSSVEGCCSKKLPTCCKDTNTCCGKGASCCSEAAGGGCCPATQPVCCRGNGQGKYCCPAGTVCCGTGCCPAGAAGTESDHQPAPRDEEAPMAARE